MDGWRFEVVQKVVDDGHPYAPWFFLTFIFIASFAVLNLFIALIVDALAADQRAATSEQLEETAEHLDEIEDELEEEFEEADRDRDEILAVLNELKAEIAELKALQLRSPRTRGPKA